MKKMNVTVSCMGVYSSSIDVPDGMSLEEAIQYAKYNIDKIPLTEIEWVVDTGIDETNCDFDDE